MAQGGNLPLSFFLLFHTSLLIPPCALFMKGMAMEKINLDPNYKDSPKFKSLHKKLGKTGVLAVIDLWCYARKHKPSGKLDNMDAKKIAMAADWEDEPEKFLDALVELSFLEWNEGSACYEIHDWAMWNADPGDVPNKSNTKSGKKKEPSPHPLAESLYQLYPRKIGKKAALDAITRALNKADYETLKAAVVEYANSPYVKSTPKQFLPHPSTWFNQERWLDDREEWGQQRDEPTGRWTSDELTGILPSLSREEKMEKIRQIRQHGNNGR